MQGVMVRAHRLDVVAAHGLEHGGRVGHVDGREALRRVREALHLGRRGGGGGHRRGGCGRGGGGGGGGVAPGDGAEGGVHAEAGAARLRADEGVDALGRQELELRLDLEG